MSAPSKLESTHTHTQYKLNIYKGSRMHKIYLWTWSRNFAIWNIFTHASKITHWNTHTSKHTRLHTTYKCIWTHSMKWATNSVWACMIQFVNLKYSGHRCWPNIYDMETLGGSCSVALHNWCLADYHGTYVHNEEWTLINRSTYVFITTVSGITKISSLFETTKCHIMCPQMMMIAEVTVWSVM